MYKNQYNLYSVLKLYRGEYHKQLYLREIARTSGLQLKTTQDTLAHLEKTNILLSETKGKHKYFRLNLNNIQTQYLLEQAELQQTINFINAHPGFSLFTERLEKTTILFGSYAKGTEDKHSDVDILTCAKKLPGHLLEKSIHKVQLSEENQKRSMKRGETLMKEVAQHHIILRGHSFFVSMMWKHAKSNLVLRD